MIAESWLLSHAHKTWVKVWKNHITLLQTLRVGNRKLNFFVNYNQSRKLLFECKVIWECLMNDVNLQLRPLTHMAFSWNLIFYHWILSLSRRIWWRYASAVFKLNVSCWHFGGYSSFSFPSFYVLHVHTTWYCGSHHQLSAGWNDQVGSPHPSQLEGKGHLMGLFLHLMGLFLHLMGFSYTWWDFSYTWWDFSYTEFGRAAHYVYHISVCKFLSFVSIPARVVVGLRINLQSITKSDR